MNFEALRDVPRLLAEVKLAPVQGSRFQPTGFPDLGAAEYTAPGRGQMLLVESAQSMANRLETVCWDEGTNALMPVLKGLPYVHANVAEGVTTNSILEAHRLNSPYIAKAKAGFEPIVEAIGFVKDEPFDRRKLATALLKYDPNSLVHGIFLEKVGGVVRLPRMLSSFIEAADVSVAPSGGVKVDRIQPASGGDNTTYGKAKDGYGNVPYHRDEFTGTITSYFNLDLALLRGLGLPDAAQRMLIGLSLYKIQKFLRDGLRLRTACDLRVDGEVSITAPQSWQLPSLRELEEAMPGLISEASPGFADPRITVVNYKD